MISLPIFLQMVLEYNALQAGLSLAPLSLSMFFIALLAGRRAGDRRPSTIIRVGFALLVLVGVLVMIPIVPRADSGLWLAIPLIVAGCGLGLLVSQLNNYTLAPISEERISEAAGVNSAGGSFGLSFGLAMAGGVMLAALAFSFTNLAESSTVLDPAEQQQVAQGLEEDAQLMSNTQLDAADRQPAAGRRGGDHPDQHRGPPAGPPGRAARAAARRPARSARVVPDGEGRRRQAVGVARRTGVRLTRLSGSAPVDRTARPAVRGEGHGRRPSGSPARACP